MKRQTDRHTQDEPTVFFLNSNFQKTTWYIIMGTILLSTLTVVSFEFLSSTFQKGVRSNYVLNNPDFSKTSYLLSAFGYFMNQGQ